MKKLNSSNLTLIHGIRGICSLIVAICHCKFFFWVGGSEFMAKYPRSNWNALDYGLFGLDLATSNGTAMVIVFFLLSGFFIGYTYRRNQWTLFNFYKVRFLRIYIPFIFSMLFAMLVFYLAFIKNNTPVKAGEMSDLVANTKASFNFITFVKTLFFLRNDQGVYMAMNFPYWSLFHEAIFYLIAPFLLMRLRWSFSVSILLYICGYFIKQQNMLMDFIFQFFFYFNMGLMLYDTTSSRARIGVNNWNWFIILGIFVMGLYANNLVGYRLSFLICSIATAWAIHQIIYGVIQEFFLLKILRYLGKLSYTLYLVHIPSFILVLLLLHKTGLAMDPYKRYYYLISLIVVLLSLPFYKLIEERSIKFIQKYRIKKSDPGTELSPESVSSVVVPGQLS